MTVSVTNSAGAATHAPTTRPSAQEKSKAVAQKQEEFLALRQKMRGAKAAHIEKSEEDVLNPLQQQREKYKARARTTGNRQADVLSRLASFSSKLKGVKVEKKASGESDEKEVASYAGQVLRGVLRIALFRFTHT